jgi:hypothetical protein
LFGCLVSLEFGFDVGISIDVVAGMTFAAGPASSPTHASMAPSHARRGLFTNAFAHPFGLLDQIVEEVADLIRHAVDHGEDLFEDVSDEIRGRDAEIGGKVPNVLGKLFGDPGMEDPFFTRMMTVMPASGGMTGMRLL